MPSYFFHVILKKKKNSRKAYLHLYRFLQHANHVVVLHEYHAQVQVKQSPK